MDFELIFVILFAIYISWSIYDLVLRPSEFEKELLKKTKCQ